MVILTFSFVSLLVIRANI